MRVIVNNVNDTVRKLNKIYTSNYRKGIWPFIIANELNLVSSDDGVLLTDLLEKAGIPLTYRIEFVKAILVNEYYKGLFKN